MRTVALLGIVASALVSGCALERSDKTGDDEGTGKAQESASTFTAPWSTSDIMRTRPIAAPLGGTIKVLAKADFSDPAGCPRAYTAELIHFGGRGEEVIGIARAYPRNQAHAEVWTALTGGIYRVQFSTTRPPKKCTLLGAVTVSVTP